MSYTAPDFSDDVIARLRDVGYTVHGGDLNEDGSVTPFEDQTDIEAADAFWFTWVQEGRDIETGPTVGYELVAWSTAMEHWFEIARIAKDLK